MESEIENLEKENIEKINAKTNHRAVTICIEKQLKDSSYYQKLLLLEIVDYSKISWKFWKYFERSEHYKVLSENLKEMEEKAFEHCKIDRNVPPTLIDGSGDGFDDDEDDEQYYEENSQLQKRSIRIDNDLYFEI
jgi:hypothetical protein